MFTSSKKLQLLKKFALKRSETSDLTHSGSLGLSDWVDY